MAEEKSINSPETGAPEREIVTMPEAVEKQLEAEIEFVPVEKTPESAEAPRPAAPPTAVGAPAALKDPTTAAVEKILEQDLGDLYVKLDPETKKILRARGDILTEKLKAAVSGARVKARKILSWIREWLRLIPGINKYFLEQEAKIKTDKILELAEEQNKKQI
ncbi:MAG: hypothetical protein PHW53_02960 [Patescibacteria group bacterium]|nr:hypothetical protein [Patescibacteria group bacterium]